MTTGARITLGLLAAVLAAGAAHAFGSGDDRGASGFRGLLLASDARIAALGGADVALPENVAAITSNPASAATFGRRAASLSATSYVMDILPASGTVVLPSRWGVWSFAASDVSYGDFARIDEFASDQGTFSANDVALHAGWARSWSHGISGGFSFGWLRSRIADYSATAAVVNAGVLWRFNGGQTSVGLAADNVGAALSSYLGGDQGMKDQVPTVLRAGVMHRPGHFPLPLAILAEVDLPRDDDANLSLGAEIRPVAPVALRVGYRSLVRYAAASVSGEKDGIMLDDRRAGGFGGLGLRVGAGFTHDRFGLDYAYGLAGPFGSIHHLTAYFLW